MDLEIEIKKLSLKPGDTILVKVPREVTVKETEDVSQTLLKLVKEIGPISVIFTHKDVDISKFKLTWTRNCDCGGTLVNPPLWQCNGDMIKVDSGPYCAKCKVPFMLTMKEDRFCEHCHNETPSSDLKEVYTGFHGREPTTRKLCGACIELDDLQGWVLREREKGDWNAK